MLTVVVLRFTLELFGLFQSSFVLGTTIQQYLEGLPKKYPSEIEEIERSLYVDDIILGGETRDDVGKSKRTVKES